MIVNFGNLAASDPMFYGRHMPPAPDQEKEFFPRGAVAFFAAMIVFFSIVWLFFYALMIGRH